MRVLLVGLGGIYHVGAIFRQALEELGYDYRFLDESKYFRSLQSSVVHKLAYHLLGRPLTSSAFNQDLERMAYEFRPHVLLVTKGPYVRPETLARLKAVTGAVLVNYATDDPFNPAISTRDLLASIKFYDHYACTKRAIMEDVRRAGCQNVSYVPFGYHPALHFPERPATEGEKDRFDSDMVFIGGYDRDRGPYFEALLNQVPGLNLHLYGGYWNRHSRLRRYWHGFAVGREYRLATSGAKIALGLVRQANRDGHSMRAFEIPACGAFMLAERTEEHLELLAEDREAAYFSTLAELVDKVRYYSNHDTERRRIAEAGFRRITEGKHTYQDRLEEILQSVREK